MIEREDQQGNQHAREAPAPRLVAAVVIVGSVTVAGCGRVVRKSHEKLAHGLLGVESDLERVGPDERAREDAAWQPGDIVPLECLERARPRSS